MTTEVPESDESAISREAHDRVKGENTALQTQVDDLTKQLADLGKMEIVRDHFTSKQVDDPAWAAKVALPNIPQDTPADQIGAFLDENFAKLYPTGDDPPPGEPVDGAETPPDMGDVPTPDATEPPGFARPSPASEGTPPGEQMVTVDDQEFKDLLASGDEDGLQRLIKSDRFSWRTQPLDQPG